MAIELKRIETIRDTDLSILGRMLDASFATNFADCPDDEKDMHIPTAEDLVHALSDGMDIWKIYDDDVLVGGAVIRTERTRSNLELFFIDPNSKGKGTGTRAWSAIEVAYPETEVWETGTPYFLKRNIHFYVNKLGFRIVKYFNEWNPMEIDGHKDDDDFFVFEKRMTTGATACLPHRKSTLFIQWTGL